MYQYNWLFEAQSIGEFFKRLGIFILIVIIFVLHFIGVSYLIDSFIKAFNDNYLLITTKIFDNIFKRLGIFILIVIIFVLHFIGVSYLIDSFIKAFNDNYLLITTKIFDNMVCLLIPAIILVMTYFRIKIKIRTRDIIYKRKNKRGSIIFYSILLSLILVFIYSLNKYTIFYENKIIKNNIIKPLEKEYSYSDIKEGDIGIKWRNRKYPSWYYYINFNDEYKVNITNGVFGDNYDLKKLIEVNNILSQKDIIRNIDKTYLDIYTIDFDEDRKNDMYELFNISN